MCSVGDAKALLETLAEYAQPALQGALFQLPEMRCCFCFAITCTWAQRILALKLGPVTRARVWQTASAVANNSRKYLGLSPSLPST